MDQEENAVWLSWLERHLAASLAADAKVPDRDCWPVVRLIRRGVLADHRAGVPEAAPSVFASLPR